MKPGGGQLSLFDADSGQLRYESNGAGRRSAQPVIPERTDEAADERRREPKSRLAGHSRWRGAAAIASAIPPEQSQPELATNAPSRVQTRMHAVGSRDLSCFTAAEAADGIDLHALTPFVDRDQLRDVYLVVEDVAQRLRCSRRTVHELTRTLSIPHRRLPGCRRCLFREDELEAWEAGAPLEVIARPGGGRIVRPKSIDLAS